MNNRKLLKYHSWIGLVLGVFLCVMGISGAILVFQHDLEEVLWKKYTQVKDSESLDIDKGVKTIQQTYPGWDTRLMHFEENEALIFNLRKPTQRLFVFVHPSTGEVLQELNELTTFTRWLLKFHYSLQAGIPGRILVFFIGILFLLSLVTGIILYRKSIIKTIFFKVKLKGRNKRTFYSSLHRIVGVWSLLLNLVLVITGIFLAWKVSTAALAQPVEPNTPPVTAPVKEVLKNLEAHHPDFTPTYIRLPLNPEGNLVVYGRYDDDAFFYSEFYNSFQAHYQTGTITGVTKVQKANLATKLSSTLIPLHFGQFGGIWSKVLYALTGLSGPFLSITGFLIWRKTKRKGKKSRKKKKYSKALELTD